MVPPPLPFSSPSSSFPTPSQCYVSLPNSVEQLIAVICTKNSVPPPDNLARRELARLGEVVSMHILREINSSLRRVYNFSGYIMHMAKTSPIAMARNAEELSTRQSGCFSGPSVGDDSDTSSVGDMAEWELTKSDQEMTSRGRIVESPPAVVSTNSPHFRDNRVGNDEIVRRRLDMEMDQACSPQNYDSYRYISLPHRVESSCQQVPSPQMNALGNLEFRRAFLILSYLGRFQIGTRTKHMSTTVMLIFREMLHSRVLSLSQLRLICNVFLVMIIYFNVQGWWKGGEEKSGTKSSVKCYFVCTASGWNRDHENTHFLYGKTINQIRLSFMHIHTVPSLAKYISRFSLILSKTLKLDIDLSDAGLNVETIRDIHCKDGNTILEGIHTDGTGFISEDLALQCPIYVSKGNIQAGRDGLSPAGSKRQKIYNNDEPPLLMQVRLFYRGLCAKGTLLVNKLLPKKTILIRPSMIKVESDPSMWGIVQPFNSLEVVNTSNCPKKVHLSRYLISLLHFGGVPAEFFLGLLSSALVEAESCRYDRGAALRVVLNNGGMDNDHLTAGMIMSGIPLDEPFLQYRLGLMMGEERKGLQAGKIPISDSYYLMGTADPTGKLRANQVCVILDKGQLSGQVLVYKHPGLHPGDIHLLQATVIEGLERVVGDSKYAIFFPVVGPRSLADEMANSDFDGDIYWVSRHPELLKNFKPRPPWVPPPEEDLSKKGAENRGLDSINNDLERLLFGNFLNNRFKPNPTVGVAAECWLVYMDRLLTPGVEKEEVWPKIEKLINIYYDALDAPKTGKKVEVGKDLKVVKYPHFMKKNGEKDIQASIDMREPSEYNSSSVLGLIYDKVQSFKAEKLQSTKFEMLPCLSGEVPKYCMNKWGVHYDNYLKEMSEALGILEDMKNAKCQEIIDCYKKILYGAKVYKERTRPKDQIKNEALAIYQTVYKKAKYGGVEKCWFAWRVAGPVLCKYYISCQEDDDMFPGSYKVMHELYGVNR